MSQLTWAFTIFRGRTPPPRGKGEFFSEKNIYILKKESGGRGWYSTLPICPGPITSLTQAYNTVCR